MKSSDILVATHGHCFDGLASAVLFTRLVRTLAAGAPRKFRYKSCGYGPKMQAVPEHWLDADENVILDFRYTRSAKLSWYFDHHITGFGSDAERDDALTNAAPAQPDARPQVYYDPAYGSCSKLIADVAERKFGVDMNPLADLIAWADIIDTARFASATAATSPDEPVLQFAAVVEHHADSRFLKIFVPRLLDRPLIEVAASPKVQALYAPIRAARATFAERVQRRAEVQGPVVLVDLSDAPLDVAAKFVTYALYPECVYSVMLSRSSHHYKLSVGYNPWGPAPRMHHIADICRRHNGGGHPAVGACSFPLAAEARAKEVARAIAEELQR